MILKKLCMFNLLEKYFKKSARKSVLVNLFMFTSQFLLSFENNFKV